MRKIIFFTGLFIFISSCATTYKTVGFAGGFSEIQLRENVFQVSFDGNGYTRKERASDFALLRSAELALEHGFRYFIITDFQKNSVVSSYTTPIHSDTTGSAYRSGSYINGSIQTTISGGDTFLIRKPSATNTIVCFREKPTINSLVYDAKFVTSSIKKKYKIANN